MLQYHFPHSAMYFDHYINIIIKIIALHPKLRSIIPTEYSLNCIKRFYSLFSVNNFHILAPINIKWMMNC